jgi:hypothetical protein
MFKDSFSQTVASLWMSEITRVYAIFVFLVIFEAHRCQLSFFKTIAYLLAPTEIGLPFFLHTLKESGIPNSHFFLTFVESKAKKTNPNALMSYCTIFVTNVLTWMWFLYRWAEEVTRNMCCH